MCLTVILTLRYSALIYDPLVYCFCVFSREGHFGEPLFFHLGNCYCIVSNSAAILCFFSPLLHFFAFLFFLVFLVFCCFLFFVPAFLSFSVCFFSSAILAYFLLFFLFLFSDFPVSRQQQEKEQKTYGSKQPLRTLLRTCENIQAHMLKGNVLAAS